MNLAPVWVKEVGLPQNNCYKEYNNNEIVLLKLIISFFNITKKSLKFQKIFSKIYFKLFLFTGWMMMILSNSQDYFFTYQPNQKGIFILLVIWRNQEIGM